MINQRTLKIKLKRLKFNHNQGNGNFPILLQYDAIALKLSFSKGHSYYLYNLRSAGSRGTNLNDEYCYGSSRSVLKSQS